MKGFKNTYGTLAPEERDKKKMNKIRWKLTKLHILRKFTAR